MFFEENVSPSARRAGPRKCFHVEVVGWAAVARPRRGNIPLKCFPVAATGAEMFPRQRGAGMFPRRHRQRRGNISGRSDGETFRELHPVECFPVAATQPFTTATGKHSQECFPVGRILPRARRAGATGETYYRNVSPSPPSVNACPVRAMSQRRGNIFSECFPVAAAVCKLEGG